MLIVICIAFVINQVSSRCLITAAWAGEIDVINVDNFANPSLIHSFSFPGSSSSPNSVAFNPTDDKLYIVAHSLDQVHSLNMNDICTSIRIGGSVPSTIIGYTEQSWGMAYDLTENRLYFVGSGTFSRMNPGDGVSTVLGLPESSGYDSLLESFDGSEGLYYMKEGSAGGWMEISNYREPSIAGSTALQFTNPIGTNFDDFTGLTWLNANEVLVYHLPTGNLYTLNVNTQIVSAVVVNLNSIRTNIKGMHLFPDLSCTNLCARGRCLIIGESCNENCDCCNSGSIACVDEKCDECLDMTASTSCSLNDECCSNLGCQFDDEGNNGRCCIMPGDHDEPNICSDNDHCCGKSKCDKKSGICKGVKLKKSTDAFNIMFDNIEFIGNENENEKKIITLNLSPTMYPIILLFVLLMVILVITCKKKTIGDRIKLINY